MKHFGQYLIDSIAERFDSSVEMPEWIGCTNAEIEALMKAQGVSTLPKAYREYLETMGKYGVMSHGYKDSWSYEHLLRFKQMFKEEFSNYNHTMPRDSFIIYQALASVFHYFRISESEEGYPVYSWDEGDNSDGTIGRIKKIAETIEEYIKWQAGLLAPPDSTIDEAE